MSNYRNLSNANDKAAYTNTDYILKSIVQSLDLIEEEEAEVVLNPQERIFSFYSKVNALYSKTNFYISDTYTKNDKEVNVQEELAKIKSKLYNKGFLDDIKLFEKNKNAVLGQKLVGEYMHIIGRVTSVYRHITYEFSRLGFFFIINKEDKRAGVTKR